MRTLILVLAAWLAFQASASAHSMMTAYLDLNEQSDGATAVDWRRPIFPGNFVTLEPVFPSQTQAFDFQPSRDEGTFVHQRWLIKNLPKYWSGASVGVTGQGLSGMEVLVRLHLANGQNHVAVLRGSGDVFTVPEHPSLANAAFIYTKLGFDHILLGVDHLLFIFGLLILVSNVSSLIKTITAFTIAHSITLALASLGVVHVPQAPINLCVALSIFFLAPEIIRKYRGGTSLTLRKPWLVAFGFGLLHGFGFASGLAALGLPRPEIPFALLFFNIGVEIGQLSFVLLALLLLRSFRLLGMQWNRFADTFSPYFIGSVGAYWTMERVALLFSTGN